MPTEKALYKLFIIIIMIIIIIIQSKGSTCVLEEKCPTYANNNKIETQNKEILDRKEISNCSMNVQTPMHSNSNDVKLSFKTKALPHFAAHMKVLSRTTW